MNRHAIVATVLVAIRFVVATIHGRAHEHLGVGLSTWQNAFVMSVIVAAPIVAAVLYWTRLRAWGALLLGVSMLAGMLFGLYYHFIAITNDNIAHLPEGDAHGLFVATAILLVPCEAAAAAFGFWSWSKLRRGAVV